MKEPLLITEAKIRELAALAELPLAKGREKSIAAILNVWLKDANELSRKMSAEEYWTLTPAMIFMHPASGGVPIERGHE